MEWKIFWALVIVIGGAILIAGILGMLFRYKYRKKKFIDAKKVFIGLIYIIATGMFFPLYSVELGVDKNIVGYLRAWLISMQHGIRIFAFDGSYTNFAAMVANAIPEDRRASYLIFGAVMYLIAPMLTVGFILSFFRNLVPAISYRLEFWRETHVFSELNEKTLAFAKSIYSRDMAKYKQPIRFFRRRLIVFTDVPPVGNERMMELIAEAREIGALIFTKDLEAIAFRWFKRSKRTLKFYLISENETEKIRHVKSIVRDYDNTDKVSLYFFSDDNRSELLLSSMDVATMSIVRINDIQSLIYHNLDVHGVRLFKNAKATDSSDKLISAVVIGMGKYGVEMIKALSWFCQIPGYKVKINAFDSDARAEEKFTVMCPELMCEELNGKDVDGEVRCEIRIHSGINVSTPEFYEELKKIEDVTYVFVCLGDDSVNLAAATSLRMAYEDYAFEPAEPNPAESEPDEPENAETETAETNPDETKPDESETDENNVKKVAVKKPRFPDIETVVYDSIIRDHVGVKWGIERDCESAHCVDGGANFNNQHYDLHLIGNLNDFYSEDTFADSRLIAEAEEIHLRWAKENNPDLSPDDPIFESERRLFYKYEYHFRSSMAKAIHERLRIKLHEELGMNFPGLGMERAEILKDYDLCVKIGLIEHVRWNAYMRSQGYTVGKKNHIAKKHENLISVDELVKTPEGKEILKKDV